MKIEVKRNPVDGAPMCQIDKPCCDEMAIALRTGFVKTGITDKSRPRLAFTAPGAMVAFTVCPWCGRKPATKNALDLMIPPPGAAPRDLRGDGR